MTAVAEGGTATANPLLGIAFKVSATFMLTVMLTLIKIASDRYPIGEIVFCRSFFALIANSDLQAGEHVLVASPIGPTVDGVEIPSDAVVLSEEKTWCYLQIAPGRFQRVQIDLSHPHGAGYFVKARPGLFVVVRGSGLLLARELGNGALHY